MMTRSLQLNWLPNASYDRRYQFALAIALSLLCFITVAPFVWVVLTSIKPNPEIYTTNLQILPQNPTLEHFQTIFEKGDKLPSYVVNTLIYAATTISVVVLFAAMAGYALGALAFRGAQLVVRSEERRVGKEWR